MKRSGITSMAKLFGKALQELLKNDPLRMAGATAFFTTFALPPILVILIQSLKFFINPRLLRSQLFDRLSGIIGHEAADQLADVLLALRKMAQNSYIAIAGFIFLLFVATTLFKVIKNSLNQVWKIRSVRKLSFWKNMRSRAKSVLIILIAGVLFVVSILAEGVQAFLGKSIYDISPGLSFYFNSVLNHVVSILIVTLWFVMVFRYLPDGRPSWRIAFAGAFVTAVLFAIGKLLLKWLLTYSNVNTLYGTSASVVLLLLFVFYTSLILYYGAAFTKIWGSYKQQPIAPNSHAMHYRIIQAEAEQPAGA